MKFELSPKQLERVEALREALKVLREDPTWTEIGPTDLVSVASWVISGDDPWERLVEASRDAAFWSPSQDAPISISKAEDKLIQIRAIAFDQDLIGIAKHGAVWDVGGPTGVSKDEALEYFTSALERIRDVLKEGEELGEDL